uniref:Putative zinc finger CCCH domain-containing protein 5 n=1 Tax=Davidia involucrata TaxID=16924 RepID=A0A5B7C740_DAVIN
MLAYHSLNSRYFAGKQVKCEFISVTRWKVAICGEYMKSRLKTCSHGTACNFIHCFRNPGGDYEWADWDKPPPKYWVEKMTALFGYSDEIGYDNRMDQESLEPLRNSSKMITVDTDRYHSRRLQSREMDCLHGNYSRSHYEENDTRKSAHRHRRTSDGRKQIKIPNEKNCEEDTNSGNNQHRKKRSHDTDSDGDRWKRDGDGDKHHDGPRKSSRYQVKVSEFRDYHGDRKSRSCESGSDGDWSDRDRDRYRGRTRKSSKHRKKVSEILDDHGYSKKRSRTDQSGDRLDEDRDGCTTKSSRYKKKVSEILDDHGHSEKQTCGTDSNGDLLDKDRDGDRQHSRRMKSSGRGNKVHESPDDHWDGKNRTYDSDSSGDWLDRDRDKHHTRTRKLSMHSNEVSGFSDNHGESEKQLKDKFHHRESDLTKRGHSSRRDHSSREASDGDFAVEDLKSDRNDETTSSGRYGQRTGSHGLSSRYNFDGNSDEVSHHESGYDFPEKHQNSKRKFRSDEIYESDSPDRYNGRSKSHDSGC